MKLFYAVIKQVAEEQSRTWRATFFSVQTHIKLLAEEGRGRNSHKYPPDIFFWVALLLLQSSEGKEGAFKKV